MKLYIDSAGEPYFLIKATDHASNTLLRHYIYLLESSGRQQQADECREYLASFNKFYHGETVAIPARKSNSKPAQNKLFDVKPLIQD